MTQANLSLQVQNTIAQTLGVDVSLVSPDLSIGEIPEWTSIGNLSIIAAIEERFKIEIPLEDLFELTTVASLINETRKLLSKS